MHHRLRRLTRYHIVVALCLGLAVVNLFNKMGRN